jgi:hypothetical protein
MAGCPLPPVPANCAGSPFTVNPAFVTPITGTPPVPDARWQSRQWQMTLNSGSPPASYRMRPQAQPPVSIS